MRTVQGDANLAPILRLEIVSVGFHSGAVSYQYRVSHDPRLRRAVALRALAAVTRAAGSKQARAVSQDGAAPRLVERNPKLDLVTKSLEADPGIVFVVLYELILVQESAVSLVQLVGKIPVEERYKRLDACSTEVVDKLDIMLHALFVYGVVAAAERDDTRPREREAIRLGARLLQELNVLRGAMVRVARHVA